MTGTVERTARRAHHAEATDKGARLGFAGTGLLHVVLAGLVGLVAVGHGGQQADQQGALRALAGTPFGRPLLVLVALGFAGYSVWRALEAAVGRRRKDGAERAAKRGLSAALAVLYAGMCAATLRVALGGSSGDTEQRSDSVTAAALGLPGGRWLVGAVGVAAVLGGLAVAVYGLRGDFREHLRDDCRGASYRIVVGLGAVGWLARGALVAVLGGFLVKAALQSDPDEARGVDGAVQELAGQPAGQAGLCLLAAGLLAYGLFCFAQTRWRHTRS